MTLMARCTVPNFENLALAKCPFETLPIKFLFFSLWPPVFPTALDKDDLSAAAHALPSGLNLDHEWPPAPHWAQEWLGLKLYF